MTGGPTSDVDLSAFEDPGSDRLSVVDRYFDYGSRATLSPAHFHAGTMLPGLCHVLHHAGVQVALPVNGHQPEHPVFWTGLLGDSGSGKTQALALQKDVIDSVHSHYLVNREDEDAPLEACLPMTGSPEGLLYKTQRWFIQKIGATPMIYYEDELSTLIGRRGSWSEFFSTMNRLYDGQDYAPEYRKDQRVDERVKAGRARKDDEDNKKTRLVHPLPSALFATTVSGLTDAGRNFMHGGFASRVFWLHVEVTPSSIRWEQSVDPELGRARGELLHAYNDLYTFWLTQRAREHKPVVVGMSDEAQTELIARLDHYRQLVGQDYVVSSHLPRLIGQAQRICCIIAAARRKHEAGPAEARFAAHLCDLSLAARMKLEDSWEDLSPKANANPQVFLRKVARCEDAIRKAARKGMTRAALLKRFRKADLDLWLEQLIESGAVFVVEAYTPRKSIRYFHEDYRSAGFLPQTPETPQTSGTVVSIPISGESHE